MSDPLVGRMIQALPTDLPDQIGVAVSGGSDSLALLHLLHACAARKRMILRAVTVDHRLRAESADEARRVGQICRGLGIAHDVLQWHEPDMQGNLQDAARRARYQLMGDWARRNSIPVVVLGHTQDDQAETVLMRLARGAGVDGLSAMRPRRIRDGITWLRPLLAVRRAELRAYLHSVGVDWIEDPGNDDPRFERIRWRQAQELLDRLGLDVPTLAQVASNMGRARDALEWQTRAAARQMARTEAGAVVIDRAAFDALPTEIARRLIVQAIQGIRGARYPPRRGSVLAMIEALSLGKAATTDGCQVLRRGAELWIFREYNAVRDVTCGLGEAWDGRWRVTAETQSTHDRAALEIRALGAEGLGQCPDWRASGCPRAVLLGTPAVWSEDKFIAAPLAKPDPNWHAALESGADGFDAALLSH